MMPIVKPLTLDAGALDQAAEAMARAGEALTSADGRPLTGPQLSHDAYRRWVLQILENVTGDAIQPSDEPLPEPTPKETWP